jgi:RNA polymerase sigma factor (sigma-70 family)
LRNLRIDHDRVSGALYIKIREGEYDHTEDFSQQADVYVDVDAQGNVLGLEALSFEDLAEAIEERGGRLVVPDVWSQPMRIDLDDIRAAISALPPRKQEVVQLLYMEGLTRSEAAERLGISVAALYRLNRELLVELRELLREKVLEPEDDASLEDVLSTLRTA